MKIAKAHSECWLLAALLMATPASAQTPKQPAPTPTPAPPDRVEAYARFGALLFDNFFQAPDGSPEEDVAGATLEGGLSLALQERRPLRAYAEGDYTLYHDLDPSAGIRAGVRLEERKQSFDLAVQYLANRPSREVRDEFDRADTLSVYGEYSHRVHEDFELTALAELRHETLELSADKDNDVYGLGGAVRYRGFGSKFSPEVGFRLGGRDVVDDNEDISQRELFLRLRWVPAPPFYLTCRYRHRSRDYSIADPAASNFGREDARDQLVATADWRRGKALVFNLYYALEDSDSSRSTGNFTTQMLSLGVTLLF